MKELHATPIQPSFSLQDIEMQANTQQSVMLEVTGTAEEYVIKSISVSKSKGKNRYYHTKEFRIENNNLKDNAIPPSGLSITLTTDQTLKPGDYELRIKIDKKGKGSKKTEQWVKCMIHVT